MVATMTTPNSRGKSQLGQPFLDVVRLEEDDVELQRREFVAQTGDELQQSFTEIDHLYLVALDDDRQTDGRRAVDPHELAARLGRTVRHGRDLGERHAPAAGQTDRCPPNLLDVTEFRLGGRSVAVFAGNQYGATAPHLVSRAELSGGATPA